MFSDGHRAEKRERWRCEGGHQKDCKALSSDYHDVNDDGDDDGDEIDNNDDEITTITVILCFPLL